VTADACSTADSLAPDIAGNVDPGNRNNRWNGPDNDHTAFPYRPSVRFGSPLNERRLYDGDCPVSDPGEIAPICFERSVCQPLCTSETCDQVSGRAPIITGQCGDDIKIAVLGSGGKAMLAHGLDHGLT